MGILNHFSPNLIPRPQQKKALLEIESGWDHYDVFVVVLPTGVGKSHIANCVTQWQEGGTIITPTNVLVDQYTGEMGHLATLPLARNTKDYGRVKRDFLKEPHKILNYYSYLSARAYSPTLVIDEAHRITPMLQTEFKLWRHLLHYPDIRTVDELVIWAVRVLDKVRAKRTRSLLERLLKAIDRSPEEYTIQHTTDYYRGKEQQCLVVHQLTPRGNAPFMWPPSRVNKLVLMSATFNKEDVYDLELDRRRVKYIETGSPIPPENRAVVYEPVGSMSYRNKTQTMPDLVEALHAYLNKHTERGFIHTTYAISKALKQTSLYHHPRIRWHGMSNKLRAYSSWLEESPEAGGVFVGCGLTEGIDLKYDRARWQVVTKIMYPSKSDPAIAAKLRHRPDWYSWVAIRDLLQAVGRVCRSPEDTGITYITDKCFSKLYTDNKDMFPLYFRQALR